MSDDRFKIAAENLVASYINTHRPRPDTTHGECGECGEQTDIWRANRRSIWWICEDCECRKIVERELWVLTLQDPDSIVMRILLGK